MESRPVGLICYTQTQVGVIGFRNRRARKRSVVLLLSLHRRSHVAIWFDVIITFIPSHSFSLFTFHRWLSLAFSNSPPNLTPRVSIANPPSLQPGTNPSTEPQIHLPLFSLHARSIESHFFFFDFTVSDSLRSFFRFELVTRGFSVLCSTYWSIPTILDA